MVDYVLMTVIKSLCLVCNQDTFAKKNAIEKWRVSTRFPTPKQANRSKRHDA